MEFSVEKFNEIKQEAENFYNNIVKVRCPFFGEDVLFNSKGLEHLIFKRWNKTRVLADQFSRLRHIRLAPEILKQSRTLQGIWSTKKIERIKKNKRWEKVMILVNYYEFIAIMESHGSKVRVKIVVKQIEGGEKFFWSIIPFWGVNKSNGEKVMYSGDPEID